MDIEQKYEDQLSDDIGMFYADPLGYVMYVFPWDTDPSIQVVELAQGVDEFLDDEDYKRQAAYRERFPTCKYGPDLWACDFLDELGAEIRKREFNGHTPVEPIRFATVSGHEIGKSTLVAWLIKFILDTRPLSMITVTAVTDEQLRTKTWAELGKWHYISATQHWFNYTASRGAMTLSHRDPKRAGRWRADARTSREEKSEAFAGQHAPTATSCYIFDEASGIGSKVFEVREGGLTSGEPMVFDFGNGTRNSGEFFENCVGKASQRYIVRQIDSRQVAITNKEKIADDARIYGEDSDFFRSRWMGLFPKLGMMQFISSQFVEDAQRREVPDQGYAPMVLGVDVARFGDDLSVIWPRQGRDARTWPIRAFSGLDTVQLTEQIISYFQYLTQCGVRPQMIFVDVGAMGAGVVDQLRHLGYPVVEVNFGAKATNAKTYRLKMDEMWGDTRDALRDDLCLPPLDSEHGQQIYDDLTQREFGYTRTEAIALESKADMKKRGLSSPDFADALVLTYAMEVAPDLGNALLAQASHNVKGDYDPMDAINKEFNQEKA